MEGQTEAHRQAAIFRLCRSGPASEVGGLCSSGMKRVDLRFCFLLTNVLGRGDRTKDTGVDTIPGDQEDWEGRLSRTEKLQIVHITQSCFKKYQADENTMIISTQ